MSIYVKCNFCIECLKLKLDGDGWAGGVCQRSGQVKRWFDVGRCIGRSHRSETEIKKIISDYVKRSSRNGSRISGLSAPDLNTMIPVSLDGSIGYRVMEERRRPRTRRTIDTASISGGEELC